MNDQSHPHDTSSRAAPGALPDLIRTVLWSALVISAAGNTVASMASANIAVHLVLGAVSAASVVGLLVLWNRART